MLVPRLGLPGCLRNVPWAGGDECGCCGRYAAGDKVERWLHSLLCLDAAEHLPPPPARLPAPEECNLWCDFAFQACPLLHAHEVLALAPAHLPASRGCSCRHH